MTQVFISHSHQDRELVQRNVCSLLESLGIRYFFASEHIPASRQWSSVIEESLNQCHWFFLIISPRAANSEWVRREVEWAMKHRRDRIFPIMIEPCDIGCIHPVLPEIQHIRLDTDRRDGLRRLIHNFCSQMDEEIDHLRDRCAAYLSRIDGLLSEQQQLQSTIEKHEARLQRLIDFDGTWQQHQHGYQHPFVSQSQRRCKIISIANVKGGVGKSTITANLGAALWRRTGNPKVLLIDLDYQADLTNLCLSPDIIQISRDGNLMVNRLFHNEHSSPAEVLSCRRTIDSGMGSVIPGCDDLAKTEMRLLVQWLACQTAKDIRYLLRGLLHNPSVSEQFDYILIDCPPRFHTACINGMTASDYVLIPVLPDRTSAQSAARMVRWVRELRTHGVTPNLDILGVVINRKSDRRTETTQLEQNAISSIESQCEIAWNGPVRNFKTIIKTLSDLAAASAQSKLASSKELDGVFDELADEVIQRIHGNVEVTV